MYISMVRIKGSETYAQHQAIWSLFPNSPDRKRDHLFRVENVSGSVSTVILQSSTQPKSSTVADVLQSKIFSLSVQVGTSYRFKLVANPTKRCSKSKAIIDIQTEEDRVAWLQNKLSGANVTVTSMDDELIKSEKCKCSRYVTYEGVIHVTDSVQIYNAVVMGVGRKKHAGAGLLSLAK